MYTVNEELKRKRKMYSIQFFRCDISYFIKCQKSHTIWRKLISQQLFIKVNNRKGDKERGEISSLS